MRETKRSSAEEARNEIVEAGLALPGIPEMLRVYGGWESAKKGLDSYHHLLKLYRPSCVATNNANRWIDDAPMGTDP
ncbi:MAG: hypothetical protein OXN18_06395 [Gemmatimonadota bacterium]|nr:hypothetical protein [Gemmatimonadota bacterium]MDE2804760.1 hypothetical protein [Gemmatimonadota bacterium]